MESLAVTARLTLPAEELSMRAVRSGGPGGQNVNKVATAVELRFDIKQSAALSEAQRERILGQLASRLVGDGVLLVRATEHREQGRNLEAARARLAALLKGALAVPKTRRATQPTRGSQRRRVEGKKLAGEKKRLRRAPGGD